MTSNKKGKLTANARKASSPPTQRPQATETAVTLKSAASGEQRLEHIIE
jgi:hypothetical protein